METLYLLLHKSLMAVISYSADSDFIYKTYNDIINYSASPQVKLWPKKVLIRALSTLKYFFYSTPDESIAMKGPSLIMSTFDNYSKYILQLLLIYF